MPEMFELADVLTSEASAIRLQKVWQRMAQSGIICACGHDESLHAKGRLHNKAIIMRTSCTFSDPVTFKFCKCEQFHVAVANAKQFNLEESEGAKVMAKEKGRKLVLFEVTAKKADELLDKENQTNAAIFYRVLVAKGEAMQRLAIYEASKSKCESNAAWERLGHQTHDTLARLRKLGFVKRIETREAASEAKAAKKERVERKPRAKRAAKSAPTHVVRATEQASAAAAANDAPL